MNVENWDQGCAIPFLELHKWDFRCSVGVAQLQEVG
jgi:hypothetical protein